MVQLRTSENFGIGQSMATDVQEEGIWWRSSHCIFADPGEYWVIQRQFITRPRYFFRFYSATQHRPPATPGNDCIPYSGWLASGDVGIACMMKIDDFLRKGGLPPAGNDYNTSTMIFLVKGKKEPDSVSVLRDPMETRPLCMNSCFNKWIMAANCSAMNAEYSNITNKTQNGFTGERFF